MRRGLTGLAGLPTATTSGGTSLKTLDRAPITLRSPTITSGPTNESAATQASSPMTTGGRISGEVAVAVVVRAGAQVRVLAHDRPPADGDLAERVEDRVVPHDRAVAQLDVPGDLDVRRRPHAHLGAHGRAEAAQQPAAPAVPVVKARAKQQLARDHPERPADVLAQRPGADERQVRLAPAGKERAASLDEGGRQRRLVRAGLGVGRGGLGGADLKRRRDAVELAVRDGRAGGGHAPLGAGERDVAAHALATETLELSKLELHGKLVLADETTQPPTGRAVEEPAAAHVHVKETPQPRHGQLGHHPAFGEPAPARRVTQQRAPAGPGVGPQVDLLGLERAVAVVLGEEVLEPAAVLVDQQVLEPPHRPVAQHVLVHQAVLVPRLPPLEEPQVPTWKVPAVANATPQEDEHPVDVEAALFHLVWRTARDGEDFVAQLRADGLVGVDDQRPRRLQRQVRQRPVLLPGVPLPRLVVNARAERLGDGDGRVGRAAVDHEHAVGPPLEALERVGEVALLVMSLDHDVQRHAHSGFAGNCQLAAGAV